MDIVTVEFWNVRKPVASIGTVQGNTNKRGHSRAVDGEKHDLLREKV